jgi:uncharacterized protein
MLRIDLGALRQGPIVLAQVVPADDPAFDKLEFELSEPVHLSGRLMDAGTGRYYWQGGLRTRMRTTCRRCLAGVEIDIAQEVSVLFTEDVTAEDPAAYVIPANSAELDPSEAVREELILAVPDYALCSEECRGLCPRCGADLNSETCGCERASDPRWAKLEAMRNELSDQEAS